MAATWTGARAAAAQLRTRALVGCAGPLVMLAQRTSWILGLWIGFALIYAGHLDQLGYAPGLTRVVATP